MSADIARIVEAIDAYDDARSLGELYDRLAREVGQDEARSIWDVYEATCRATILVAEMKANLQDVMDRWTPEQRGLGPS